MTVHATYYQRNLVRRKVEQEFDYEVARTEAPELSDYTYRMRGSREVRAARLLEARGLGRTHSLQPFGGTWFRPSKELIRDLYPERQV